MPSFGTATDGQITPGRSTLAYFDLTETALIEDAFSVTRAGAEIARDVAVGLANDTPEDDNARHSNVIHWSSGAVTLKPLQNDISNIHEGVVCFESIISLPSKMTLIESLGAVRIQAEEQYRQNADLPGFAASSNIQPHGDPFLVKHIPAGQTWANLLSDGQPTPEFVTQDIPMDRVGYSNDVYPENQAFFIRWEVPGASSSVYQYTWAFYFGQYSLCLKGTGIAELWEYCQNAASPHVGNGLDFQWHRRTSWRYARAGQLSATSYSMAIFPHADPKGRRYISFTNNQLEAASVVSQFARTDSAQVAPGEYVYRVDEVTRDPRDRDESPGHATKAAIIRFDIRRDLRLKVQISTLAWPAAGFLIDLPADLPPIYDASVPVKVYANTQSPPGCSVTASLQDANTGAAYTVGTSAGPRVRFDFAGNGQTTPILWEYRLVRPAVTTTAAPGIFHAHVNEVSVTGVSGDASQDTAHIVIKDVKAGLSRLRARGRFSFLLAVTDASGTVVLHRGYALRPMATKRGKAGGVYPAADWRDFSIPVAGMAQRLTEKYQGPVQRKYAGDGGAVPDSNGNYPPWKVTNVIADLLSACGYPPEQINIPDLDIRIWPGETVKADDYILDAAGNYFEYLIRLVRDFLGAYLIFDANAGSADANGFPLGQWTILFQTPYPDSGEFTPLYNFVTKPASATATPPHLASAYPSLTAPIFGKIEYTNCPPEFNSVLVTTSFNIAGISTQGAVSSRAYNHNSFPVPGSGITPDPEGPDYIGYERKMIYPDMTLGSAATLQETQAACDWVCRRLYDFACHSQRLSHFTAPLVFVTDPVGGYRRPLRFQDPISINGDDSWLVKACHPRYAKDGYQIAEIEAIRPVSGQYVPAGIEHLSFFRTAQAQHARQATGAATQSERFARRSPPPHRVQALLELPNLLAYQQPLQDSVTGKFYAIADYGPADSGDPVR